MAQTFLYGSLIQSGSIPATALGGGVLSSSAQLPTGTISSSAQVDYNSIQNKLSGVVSASAQVTPLLPAGTVSSSGQIDYNSITNKLSGVYSSSTQAVAAIAGQTIAPAIINATGAISGASIQTSGNGTIGGNLTVTGTLTATSQSVQYVSSSQFSVATNKITVNNFVQTISSYVGGGGGGNANTSGIDYYTYINYQWLEETSKKIKKEQKYYVQVDSFRVTQEKVYYEVIDMVKEYIKQNKHTKKGQEVNNIYQSCLFIENSIFIKHFILIFCFSQYFFC